MMSFSITIYVNIKTKCGKTYSDPYRMRESAKSRIKQKKPVS